MITTGCCGWSESHGKYFQDFGVIEVQETFYQPAKVGKYEKWRAEAPSGFEFAVKAWQLITHEPRSPTYRRLANPIAEEKAGCYGSFRPTEEVFAAWQVTTRTAEALQANIILFQCPASFAPTSENKKNLTGFFTNIQRDSHILIWEPRGDWQDNDVQAICRDLDLVHCVDPLKSRAVAGEIRYFRLHGLPGYNLSYKYSDEDLQLLLTTADLSTVYVMFNNFSMLDDALRFQRLI